MLNVEFLLSNGQNVIINSKKAYINLNYSLNAFQVLYLFDHLIDTSDINFSIQVASKTVAAE